MSGLNSYSNDFGPLTLDELDGHKRLKLTLPIRAEHTNIDGKFDAKSYTKALQEYNREKNKNITNDVSDQKLPEGCSYLYDEDDLKDTVLRFTKNNTTSTECIHLSTFMNEYVNNLCNIYVTWTRNADDNDFPDADGHTFSPKFNINDLWSAFDSDYSVNNSNKVNIFDDVYWKFPFFGGCFLKINALIKIQHSLLLKDDHETKIKTFILMEPSKKRARDENNENVRIGNIYGSFDSSLLHGQNHTHTIYDINDNAQIVNTEPPFFKFKDISNKLSHHISVDNNIKKDGNYDSPDDTQYKKLYQLLKQNIDLCSPIKTPLEHSLIYYNNAYLVHYSSNELIDEFNALNTTINEHLIEDINYISSQFVYLKETDNYKLSEFNNIIHNNYVLRDKLIDIYQKLLQSTSGGKSKKRVKKSKKVNRKRAKKSKKSKNKSNKTKRYHRR